MIKIQTKTKTERSSNVRPVIIEAPINKVYYNLPSCKTSLFISKALDTTTAMWHIWLEINDHIRQC